MLKIYQSNDLNTLINKICSILYNPSKCDCIYQEYFIIRNIQFQHWINNQIAYHTGISANIKFLKFNNFIFKLLNWITKNKFYQYDPHLYHIKWKIMNILENQNILKYFTSKKSIYKKYEFSTYISKLFYKYSLYRINWINNWKKKIIHKNIFNDYIWQIDLWNQCNKNIIIKNKIILWNYNQIIQLLSKKIKKYNQNIHNLPKRIFMLNHFDMNEYQFKILTLISKIIDVNLFLVTPTINFKVNSTYQKKQYYEIKKKIYSIQNIHQKKNCIIDYKLLLKWEIQGYRCLLFLIKNLNFKIQYIQKKKNNNSILNHIQNEFNNIQYNKKKKINLKNNDQSISIHICETIYHEVQILYNNIMNLLNKKSNILIHDIAVTAYNLDIYIPFIHTIFQSPFQKTNIPYIICYEKNKKINVILNILKPIFNLPTNNFKYKDIFFILENYNLFEKFEIHKDEICVLKRWIKDVNIICEFHNIKQKKLKYILNNTWKFGINQMLLGCALNKNHHIWKNIIPYSHIEGQSTNLLSKFIFFIMKLKEWQKKLLFPKKIKNWYNLLSNMIKDFINSKNNFQQELYHIKHEWKKIIISGIHIKYKKKIHLEIIYKQFLKNIHNKMKSRQIIFGKLPICQIESILTIPFKIIYVLGMNETKYVSKNNFEELNLINIHPHVEDFNIKNYNRYLFLNIIHATQKKLYISYSSSIEETSKIKLKYSYIIDELLTYIFKNYIILKNNKILNKKEILSFLIIRYNNLTNKNKNYCINNSNNNNNNNKSSNIVHYHHKYNINFKKIILFWKNPIHYFFYKHLKIKFDIYKKYHIEQYEYFNISPLNQYIINENIIKYKIKKKDINKLFRIYNYQGILPNKNFNFIFWDQQKKKINLLYRKIYNNKNNKIIKNFDILCNKYKIYGNLELYDDQKIIHWIPNILKFKNIIQLWLEHLIYCMLGGKQNSEIFGLPNIIVIFPVIQKKIAALYMQHYIKGYLQGLQSPILLLQCGINWINNIYDFKEKKILCDKNSKIISQKKLIDTWNGNIYFPGEKENIYIKKIIPFLNQQEIQKIQYHTKQWVLPILKKQKIKKF